MFGSAIQVLPSDVGEYLSWAPTSICHFFHPSVCPSHIISQEPYIISDHNFWYTHVHTRFIYFFEIFIFWAANEGWGMVKGQKMALNEK